MSEEDWTHRALRFAFIAGTVGIVGMIVTTIWGLLA